MTAITIRNVPEPTLTALRVLAAEGGRSLQGYVLDVLIREAQSPSLSAMMARLDRTTSSTIDTADILDAIGDSRSKA